MGRTIEKDKKIDRFRLDEECEQQPDLYYFYSSQTADLKKERDILKVQLKEQEGKVTLGIHTGQYPLPKDKAGNPVKISNPIISAIVDTDEDVCILREDLAEAEAKLSKAQSAEETMQQRRSSLNNLVELFTKEYYAPVQGGARPHRSKGDDISNAQREGLNSRKNKNAEED